MIQIMLNGTLRGVLSKIPKGATVQAVMDKCRLETAPYTRITCSLAGQKWCVQPSDIVSDGCTLNLIRD